MQETYNQENVAELLNCLSLLESKTSLLYQTISGKISLSSVATSFDRIILDSKKHARLLKEISEGFGSKKTDESLCSQRIGESWMVLSILESDIANIKMINTDALPDLSRKLMILERVIGEEYFSLVQMKSLKLKNKEKPQDLDLGKVRGLFAKLLAEEEMHIEVLESIQRIWSNSELV